MSSTQMEPLAHCPSAPGVGRRGRRGHLPEPSNPTDTHPGPTLGGPILISSAPHRSTSNHSPVSQKAKDRQGLAKATSTERTEGDSNPAR